MHRITILNCFLFSAHLPARRRNACPGYGLHNRTKNRRKASAAAGCSLLLFILLAGRAHVPADAGPSHYQLTEAMAAFSASRPAI